MRFFIIAANIQRYRKTILKVYESPFHAASSPVWKACLQFYRGVFVWNSFVCFFFSCCCVCAWMPFKEPSTFLQNFRAHFCCLLNSGVRALRNFCILSNDEGGLLSGKIQCGPKKLNDFGFPNEQQIIFNLYIFLSSSCSCRLLPSTFFYECLRILRIAWWKSGISRIQFFFYLLISKIE